MIKLLITLRAVFISPLAAAEWVEFSKGTDSKYYYDPETLTNKRYTRVMILINYKNKNKKDKWGLPALHIDCEFKENEKKMRIDMRSSAAEMLETAGIKNVGTYDNMPAPGFCIHEMGTARMGKDPKTSVLNKWNQMHEAKNVFITDGSAMASAACQNPSLTYMALTARAADFAVSELKKGNL